MKVILINEDNHGQIGVANNYYNAVKWLIKSNWLSSGDGVFRDGKWENVRDVFGENWADLMLNEWDINTFNDCWDGCFHLEVVTIIGTEED